MSSLFLVELRQSQSELSSLHYTCIRRILVLESTTDGTSTLDQCHVPGKHWQVCILQIDAHHRYWSPTVARRSSHRRKREVGSGKLRRQYDERCWCRFTVITLVAAVVVPWGGSGSDRHSSIQPTNISVALRGKGRGNGNGNPVSS